MAFLLDGYYYHYYHYYHYYCYFFAWMYADSASCSLLSVELGRVLMIDDRDCDITLPCPLDDHLIFDSGLGMSNGNNLSNAHSQAGSHFLLTTIHVVRTISELLRSLQSPIISSQTLIAFDSHFGSCQAVFPANCQIFHPQPLEPRHLSPILQLQNCRIVLHRHNLSTFCPPDVRAAAAQSCLQIAKETVQLLIRVRKYQPPSQITWSNAVASAATTMVCTHIWRCMLFLCSSANYDEALTCAQICAAIGDFKQVNIACGRYLYGFLRQLADKIACGVDLMKDEMILALVSGDVQGSSESAWIWNGSETGTALNGATPPGQTSASAANGKGASRCAAENAGGLSDGEKWEWHGWEHIKEIIQQLKREKIHMDYQRHPPHPPLVWGSQMMPPAPHAGNQSSISRISIANII